MGKEGERAAEKFLRGLGYKVLARNFRTRLGEIDIIAQDGICVVFVEVKTRVDESYGRPEEAVTREKQRHIIRAAQLYLNQHKIHDALWRVDVIALLREGGGFAVRHLKNAVTV